MLAHRETKEIIAKGLLYQTIFKCPPIFLDYLKNKRKIYFIRADFEHPTRVCLVNYISINTTWPDFSSFWPERKKLIHLDSDGGRVWWSLWRHSRLPSFHHPGDVRFWDFIWQDLKCPNGCFSLNEPCRIMIFDETMSALKDVFPPWTLLGHNI